MADGSLEDFKGIFSARELETIKAMRQKAAEDDEREVRIKTADGHEATIPFAAARNWLIRVGILVEDEEPGEETEDPEEAAKAAAAAEEAKKVRFGGRRVS
jgi:hypothetical protein